MLAAMAASVAATACCSSGLKRMMSFQAGPSSSVRFLFLQPRSYSVLPLNYCVDDFQGMERSMDRSATASYGLGA